MKNTPKSTTITTTGTPFRSAEEVPYPDTMPEAARKVLRDFGSISKTIFGQAFVDETTGCSLVETRDFWKLKRQISGGHETETLAKWPHCTPAEQTQNRVARLRDKYSKLAPLQKEVLARLIESPASMTYLCPRLDRRWHHTREMIQAGVLNYVSAETVKEGRLQSLKDVTDLAEVAEKHPRAKKIVYIKPEHRGWVEELLAGDQRRGCAKKKGED